jgi:myo-inositol 2-dehydrogenase / D-chiro-inositol 1-dehydrogenase
MSFKIAIIGCGWVSSACHGPACVEYAASHPNVSLAACCDLDLERAKGFAVRFGFKQAFSDVSVLLDEVQPDAVCLNVPPQNLADLGCAVMKRGIALLSEKPPGLSVAEVDRLIASAQSSGVIHQVAFNRRFMPLVLELKRSLASQTIQHLDIQQARVQRTDSYFATTAIHAIDCARFLAGCDFTQVRLDYQELPEIGPGVANYTLDCRFSSGATAHFSIHPLTGINIERTIVYARDNTYFLDANNGPDAPGHLRHYENGQLITDLDAALLTGRKEDYYLNGFYNQSAAFFDAVQAAQQPLFDFRSARQSVEIMQAMIERKASCP